jgi:hypothetical protein
MAEIALENIRREKRLRRSWLVSVLLHPRKAFEQIAAQTDAVWLLPLVVISLAVLANVGAAGSIKQAAAAMGEVQIPPEMQYWPPEQQAQYVQAVRATSGPVFVYVFPALKGLALVWFGWLMVSGLVHLILTTLGGRGDIGTMVNIVAWAGLPYGVRELVRAGSMLFTRQLIQFPGLAGFAPSGDDTTSLVLLSVLALIDLYVIWHIVLLVIGTQAGSKLSLTRTLVGILLTIIIALALQASTGYAAAKFSDLKIIQPMMY